MLCYSSVMSHSQWDATVLLLLSSDTAAQSALYLLHKSLWCIRLMDHRGEWPGWQQQNRHWKVILSQKQARLQINASLTLVTGNWINVRVIFDAVVFDCVAIVWCKLHQIYYSLLAVFALQTTPGSLLSGLLSVSYECDRETCSEALKSRLDV